MFLVGTSFTQRSSASHTRNEHCSTVPTFQSRSDTLEASNLPVRSPSVWRLVPVGSLRPKRGTPNEHKPGDVESGSIDRQPVEESWALVYGQSSFQWWVPWKRQWSGIFPEKISRNDAENGKLFQVSKVAAAREVTSPTPKRKTLRMRVLRLPHHPVHPPHQA